jgi:hypothetical protein
LPVRYFYDDEQDDELMWLMFFMPELAKAQDVRTLISERIPLDFLAEKFLNDYDKFE